MPLYQHGDTAIYYEEHGHGFPLLLIAPGAMNSTIEMWNNAAINPLNAYAEDFRLIAMDQRNSGRSSGPLDVSDPWGAYARDQLALLDYLDIGACHVMGCCIGGSFALKLMELAPSRITAAVLEQPVGRRGARTVEGPTARRRSHRCRSDLSRGAHARRLSSQMPAGGPPAMSRDGQRLPDPADHRSASVI